MSKIRTAALVMAALLAAACGGSGAESSKSGGEPIKIGLAIDQTGLYSFAGVPSKQAGQLAVDEVNAKGGINGRKIELIDGDAGSAAPQAITLINKYASDPSVIAVFGPNSSAVAPAVAPVARDRKMPVFGPTIVTPLMTADNPWTFKMGANPDGVGKRLCAIVKALNLKRIAMVFTRDNTGQVGYKDVALQCLPSTGATVATVQSATDATDDYSSFITNIKNSNPDGIFTLLSGERSAQFEVQARQAGIPPSIRFYGPNTVTGANFIQIGKQAVEGTVGVTEYFPGTDNETNKHFVAAYQAKYGNLPDNYAAQGYALMSALIEGLKRSGAKITRESLVTNVGKLSNQPTVMGLGKLTFQDHNPVFDLVVVQVQGGKLILFKDAG